MEIEPPNTPWQRGYDDGFARKPGPPFPAGNADWATRLYAAGWSSGADARQAAEIAEKAAHDEGPGEYPSGEMHRSRD